VATEERPAAVPATLGDARTAETVEEVIRARLSAALGGIRGSVETALPTVAFIAAWVWRHDVRTAVGASAVVALVLLVSRLAARQTPRYVLSAVGATAVAAFFALRSGRAEDAFLPGILASAAWGAAALVSVVARWPVVGFIVAAGDPRMAEDPLGWRRDRGLVRVCQRLTMVLVGLYALRVAIMLPMYLAGEVTLLGIAKIVLGWPAYLGAVALMGLILVRGRTAPAPLPEPEA
jgi:Protein of unknown function (DUF3159)